MGLRTESEIIARAKSDPAVLTREISHGPEGGGSLAYSITAGTPLRKTTYVISSDFSPGNGSKPQSIPPEQCIKRLEQLALAASAARISAAQFHPEACKQESRLGAVTLQFSQP